MCALLGLILLLLLLCVNTIDSNSHGDDDTNNEMIMMFWCLTCHWSSNFFWGKQDHLLISGCGIPAL